MCCCILLFHVLGGRGEENDVRKYQAMERMSWRPILTFETSIFRYMTYVCNAQEELKFRPKAYTFKIKKS
jgi:hypothetical protein